MIDFGPPPTAAAAATFKTIHKHTQHTNIKTHTKTDSFAVPTFIKLCTDNKFMKCNIHTHKQTKKTHTLTH